MAEALTTDPIKVPHGFFTRRGGVSGGAYASLNCSLSGQDDRGKVMENRARVARSLDLDPGRLLGLTQVHGTHVVTATEPWPPGAGRESRRHGHRPPWSGAGHRYRRLRPGAVRRLPARAIVGATHAGWRGAVAGVLEATVCRHDRAGLLAGADHRRRRSLHQPRRPTRSDPTSATAVLAGSATDSAFFAPGQREDRWQFDLPGYCAARLRAARRRPRHRYRNRYPGRGGPLLQSSQTHACRTSGRPTRGLQAGPDWASDLGHQAGVIERPE